MRFVVPCSFVIVAAGLSVGACGGSSTPTPAAPESSATPEAEPAAAEAPSKPEPEADGWAGEKTESSGETPVEAKASTEPAAANGKAPETRTMDVIRKLVMDHRKAARQCYDDARKEAKDLRGDVVIHFVLNPEGKVKLAELNRERSTLTAPAVVDCVLFVIKSIEFPKSSRAMETSTNYPFNFTP